MSRWKFAIAHTKTQQRLAIESYYKAVWLHKVLWSGIMRNVTDKDRRQIALVVKSVDSLTCLIGMHPLV